MSNITIKNLQDAEAFLNAHKSKVLEKDFDYITCTMKERINSLDDLGGYDTHNLIELINAEVTFRTIGRALSNYKEMLKQEKENEEL